MMQKEIRLHKKILRKKILRRIAAVMIMQGIIWGIIFFGKQTVLVKAATQNEQQEESTSLALQEQLLDEIQIDDMQKMLNEIMADHTFSVREALLNLINGEEPISKETVRSFLCSLFFSEMKNEKEMIWKLLLIILIAAVLAEFADVFGDGQVGSISFYIVYLALFMILMENFTRLGNVLSQRLMGLVNFMKVLSPAYFMTVTASTGAATATVFYEGVVDGWDDPRLVSIAALRRRGFTPESIKMFVDLVGVTKAQGSVEYPMLEYCIREDLKLKVKRMMAILDPVKLVIDNYPEDQVEYMDVANNQENPEMGTRKVPFTKELYIEREDFMEEPPKKYFRMFPGNEVRLMNAYYVTCTGVDKDENGNINCIHCTYDPETKGGNFAGRKVKGTIHWVSASRGINAEVRLYDNIVDEEKGVYNEDGSMNINPNSLTILKNCVLEPELANAKPEDRFQFVRNGYFCVDNKDSKGNVLVFNRIVSLKSSFKLQK